jgi:hypothetical protein
MKRDENMDPLEVGKKYRIRKNTTGPRFGPIPGLSQDDPLTAFLEAVQRGFRTRHFLFRSRSGWRISLNDWEVEREYEIKAG